MCTNKTHDVQKPQELLATVVSTILTCNVRDDILRQAVQTYARAAGLTYEQAVQTVIAHVKARVEYQLDKLGHWPTQGTQLGPEK